jgi:hypothetical protein
MRPAPQVRRRWLAILATLLAGCDSRAITCYILTPFRLPAGAEREVEAGRLAVLGTILPAQTAQLGVVLGGPPQSAHVAWRSRS